MRAGGRKSFYVDLLDDVRGLEGERVFMLTCWKTCEGWREKQFLC